MNQDRHDAAKAMDQCRKYEIYCSLEVSTPKENSDYANIFTYYMII